MPVHDDLRFRHYATVARAIAFIRDRATEQPSLEAVAAAVRLSPAHLQRVFSEWAGLSPKRFLQFLTKEYALRLLASSDTLDTALSVGLSGTSRLHDLMVSCEAMTPGEIRSGGTSMTIGYGFAPSPFGMALVAWTGRGVCHFAFCTTNEDAMLAELTVRWPYARFSRDPAQAAVLLADIFPKTPTRGRVHLVLRGTNFQIKVWEALIRVAPGELISYSHLARQAGVPLAARAVGSALAANMIGYLIPCHRVIRESGVSGTYRWGAERKLALIGWEAAVAAVSAKSVSV